MSDACSLTLTIGLTWTQSLWVGKSGLHQHYHRVMNVRTSSTSPKMTQYTPVTLFRWSQNAVRSVFERSSKYLMKLSSFHDASGSNNAHRPRSHRPARGSWRGHQRPMDAAAPRAVPRVATHWCRGDRRSSVVHLLAAHGFIGEDRGRWSVEICPAAHRFGPFCWGRR